MVESPSIALANEANRHIYIRQIGYDHDEYSHLPPTASRISLATHVMGS
jgi:hypothetical protein